MAGIKKAKRCKVLYDMWVDIVWTINGVDHPSFFFHGGINCQFMETQGTKKDMEWKLIQNTLLHSHW